MGWGARPWLWVGLGAVWIGATASPANQWASQIINRGFPHPRRANNLAEIELHEVRCAGPTK